METVYQKNSHKHGHVYYKLTVDQMLCDHFVRKDKTEYTETCLERPLPWETFGLERPYMVLKDHIFLAEGPTFSTQLNLSPKTTSWQIIFSWPIGSFKTDSTVFAEDTYWMSKCLREFYSAVVEMLGQCKECEVAFFFESTVKVFYIIVIIYFNGQIQVAHENELYLSKMTPQYGESGIHALPVYHMLAYCWCIIFSRRKHS